MTPRACFRDDASRAIVTRVLSRMRHGKLTVIEPGRTPQTFGRGTGPVATMTINDPRTWRAFLHGSYGLGRAYADGCWDSDDLVALTRVAARNVHGLDRARKAVAPARHPIQQAARRMHAPTIGRSRRQIEAHYDLGNDLFASFLDETLSYSCGLFESPEATLAEASIAKLDHACRKLALSARDQLLEIGTGWGALAVHAAREYGCRVTTTTISKQQHAVAVERVRQAGLTGRVTVLQNDYRALAGRYDKLVSIEMIEAVGWQFFDTYFDRCSALLKPDGLMLLQAITIDDAAYEVEKGGRSFVNSLIFPGGCLPSRAVIEDAVARVTDMRPAGFEDMTPHYVLTLRHWRERFHDAALHLASRGYDRRFRRLWDLYLAYSEGGFAERRIGVGQHLLAKPANVQISERPPAAATGRGRACAAAAPPG